MLPIPAIASQVSAPPSSDSGLPSASATGPTTSSPVSITHASVDHDPISGLARDAVSIVTAHATAAPRPPRTAIMRHRERRLALRPPRARPVQGLRLDGAHEQRRLLDVPRGGPDRRARRPRRLHPRPGRDRLPRPAAGRGRGRGAHPLRADRDEEPGARARAPRRRPARRGGRRACSSATTTSTSRAWRFPTRCRARLSALEHRLDLASPAARASRGRRAPGSRRRRGRSRGRGTAPTLRDELGRPERPVGRARASRERFRSASSPRPPSAPPSTVSRMIGDRRPNVRSISDSSRPTSSHQRRSTSSLCLTRSRSPPVFQASAYLATVCSVFRSPLPPIRIGRCAWTGGGLLQHVLRVVEAAARDRRPAAEHRPHQLDRLVEPVQPLAEAGAELDARTPCARSRTRPRRSRGSCAPAAHVVERGDHLHDEGRVAERVRADHQAEPHVLGVLGPARRASGTPRTSARRGRRRSGRGGPRSTASRSRAGRRARRSRAATASRCTAARRGRRASPPEL